MRSTIALHAVALPASCGRNTRPAPYEPAGGKVERHHLAEKPIRHLDQDAGAVAGVRIGSAGAAVFEVDEEVEGRADYRVRARALDVGDKADAARVMFFTGAIEAPLVTSIAHGCFPNRIAIRENHET